MLSGRGVGMSEPRDVSVIPQGSYCYEPLRVENGRMVVKPCPYWSSQPERGEQQYGHCAFLGYGDWEVDGVSLLWDQVKECGQNMDEEIPAPPAAG